MLPSSQTSNSDSTDPLPQTALFAQAEFRIYSEHPRLFLNADHLKRLKRDAERQTARWRNLQTLLASDSGPAEPGFAYALAYQAADDSAAGRKAVDWALERTAAAFSEPGELRSAALVFDWCRELLSEEEKQRLVEALARGAEAAAQLAGGDIERVRDGVLAAIALAGDWDGSEAALGAFLTRQWPQDIVPLLKAGHLVDRPAELIALIEISSAVRPNLETDLWADAPTAFRSLPWTRVLSYYPEAIETPAGPARRRWKPCGGGGPCPADPRDATLERIADLLLVGYDGVSRDFQFLQGWLRNDSFTLKGPLGAPYEFLWLNPYLPGLSASSGPETAHDPVRGRFFARKGFNVEDLWIAYGGGRFDLYADGEMAPIRPQDKQAPLSFAGSVVVLTEEEAKLELRIPAPRNYVSPRIYLLGLREGRNYDIRLNKKSWLERQAERGGILVLHNDPENGESNIDFDKKIRLEIRPGAPPSRGKRPTLGPKR